jgi:hypothetical protein
VGHGGRGRRQKNISVIPGLPTCEYVNPDDLSRIEQFWAEGPSESRFAVPARAQLRRRDTRERQKRRRRK